MIMIIIFHHKSNMFLLQAYHYYWTPYTWLDGLFIEIVPEYLLPPAEMGIGMNKIYCW